MWNIHICLTSSINTVSDVKKHILMYEKFLSLWHECYYTVSTYKLECTCYFVAAFGSCMTCHQMLQGFPCVSEWLLHRNSKITCLYLEHDVIGLSSQHVDFFSLIRMLLMLTFSLQECLVQQFLNWGQCIGSREYMNLDGKNLQLYFP